MMTLFVLGISHRTAAIALREQLAIPSCELEATLRRLRQTADVQEAVVLSTCNRLECYVVSPNPLAARQGLVEFLASRSHLAPEAFLPALYHYTDRDAVEHLFRVAAGLDSMVLGESDITAQVKQAYLGALAQGAAGPVLNQLFQKALHSTKAVRSRTRIAEGEASVGSIVVRLASSLFAHRLESCRVLLWGAGKAAETTARHLVKHGIEELWIVNRTAMKAQELATLCRGGWVSWDQALKCLAQVDIAIVCTQAPHYVLDTADLVMLLPQRQGRPLVLIDLAVPRNVDPLVAREPSVRLYDIDTLQRIAQETVAKREQQIEPCEAIIQEQVGYCVGRIGQWA